MEIGVACATFGLVLASLIGGPVAKFLVTRHQLVAGSDDNLDVGIDDEADPVSLNYMELRDTSWLREAMTTSMWASMTRQTLSA